MAILKSRLFLKIMVSYVVLLLAVLVATYAVHGLSGPRQLYST